MDFQRKGTSRRFFGCLHSHTHKRTQQLQKLEAWTVEQPTGTLGRVKVAVEEVTGSLSMVCTGLFHDAFTISETSQAERQGESRGELSKWIKQRQDTRAELCLTPGHTSPLLQGDSVSHCLKLGRGRTLELSSTGQQLPSHSPWYHCQ